MGVSMIADLVSLAVNALGQRIVGFRLSPDQKECGGGVLLLKDIENLRRPLRVGPVVEGDRDLIGACPITSDAIRFRQRVHGLIADQAGGIIHGYFALPVSGRSFYVQDLAVSLHVHILAGWHVGDPVWRSGVE